MAQSNSFAMAAHLDPCSQVGDTRLGNTCVVTWLDLESCLSTLKLRSCDCVPGRGRQTAPSHLAQSCTFQTVVCNPPLITAHSLERDNGCSFTREHKFLRRVPPAVPLCYSLVWCTVYRVTRGGTHTHPGSLGSTRLLYTSTHKLTRAP